jgi:transposase-like protein
VLIAIGVDWEGRRQVLDVELANRESRSRWRDFLVGLKRRGLFGVEFVVSDDHQVRRRSSSISSSVRGQSSRIRRDNARSARSRPSVWQRGQ